jgi:hypothetical protein
MGPCAERLGPESRPTACRGIKTSDLKNCASARKALLSNECKQSRVVFALNYVCVSRSEFLGTNCIHR